MRQGSEGTSYKSKLSLQEKKVLYFSKGRSNHTMKHCSAKKRHEVPIPAVTGTDAENGCSVEEARRRRPQTRFRLNEEAKPHRPPVTLWGFGGRGGGG